MNGFAKTGVWPVNRDVFQDCHFVAAMQFETEAIPVKELPEVDVPVSNQIPGASVNDISAIKATPSTSNDESASLLSTETTPTSKVHVPLDTISPFPDKTSPGRGSNKIAQKAVVITRSPYKQKLEEAEQKRTKSRITKRRRLQTPTTGKSVRAKLIFFECFNKESF